MKRNHATRGRTANSRATSESVPAERRSVPSAATPTANESGSRAAESVEDPKQDRSDGEQRRSNGSKRSDSRSNGAKTNGAKSNGAKTNGAKTNGSKRNGSKRNGSKRNGSKRNGTKSNGPRTNGSSGATRKNGNGRSVAVRITVEAAGNDDVALEDLDGDQLIACYRKHRTEQWRDIVVERHLPDVVDLARTLSSRLPNSIDLDDLVNAGYSGLLRCLETFDPDKGRGFVSYMKQRVWGSMIDELRALDWLPRLMRSRLAHRDRIGQQLREELGRAPCDEEIADRLGVSLASYHRSFPAHVPFLGCGVLSGVENDLDRIEGSIVGFGASAHNESPHPLTGLYHQELMERIQDLLNETEWDLVQLHYFEGLNLKTVAKRLSLSPARICQIHGRVLLRLKEKLREESVEV